MVPPERSAEQSAFHLVAGISRTACARRTRHVGEPAIVSRDREPAIVSPPALARSMHFCDVMQIPMKITFHGLNRSDSLEAWIREWAAKLDSVYPRIVRCDVAVEAPHARQGPQYHVRIDLTVPNGEIVVSRDPGPNEAHKDPYVAVRDSFRAARRQLEDHARTIRP
jgi:ribosome-associated translation inhibitor RaiA